MSPPSRPIAIAALVATLSFGGAAVGGSDAVIALPAPRLEGSMSVERALAARRSRREFAAEPLSLASAAQLLWAAQGITDPKGLRTAPSAGALYPLEIVLVSGHVSGLAAGVYRYDPHRHRLRATSNGDVRKRVADAALDQEWIAEAPAILVIAAVYGRTARKYRTRTERYVHIEAGHAAQNVYLQAEAMGLGTTIVGAFHDRELSRVLGLEPEEQPIGILPIGKPPPGREPSR